MRVLFYRGNEINLNTKMEQGNLTLNNGFEIKGSSFSYCVENIQKVEIKKIQIGTMIRIETDTEIIYLTVPRIYMNIGNGFAIINMRKTCKLADELKKKYNC